MIEEDTGLEFAGPGWGIYEDVTPPPGRTVWYAVQARNAAGLSPQSNAFEADIPGEAVPDPDLPAAPTGLTGTAEHDRVSLTWDDPGDDSITGYQVLRGTRVEGQETQFQVLVDDTASSEASYVDTSVEPETAYAYRIRARNAGVLGPESGDFDADTPAPPVPSAPDLLGTALTGGQVSLIWSQDPPDDSISGYRILRGESENSLAEIMADTGSTDKTYTDTDPPTGQTVYYAVQARNAAGLSEQSNTRSADVPAAETEEDPQVSAQQSMDPVLVSNLSQPSSTATDRIVSSTVQRAQAFTTGNNPGGYRLTGVQLELALGLVYSNLNVGLNVELREYNANTPTGTLLHTFTNPPDLFSVNQNLYQTYTFTADDPVDLDPSTTYFVRVRHTGLSAIDLRFTASDAEDATSEGDWAIADVSRLATEVIPGSGPWTDDSEAIKMALLGTPVQDPPPTDDLLASNIEMTPGTDISLAATGLASAATSFTAGPLTTGTFSYLLESVQLYLEGKAGEDTAITPLIAVHADSGGSPGRRLYALTNPDVDFTSEVVSGLYTFTAPGNAELRAGATYWLVVKARGASVLLGSTSEHTETSTHGFTIGDSTIWVLASGTQATLPRPLRMELRGLPHRFIAEPEGEDLPLSFETPGLVIHGVTSSGSLTDPEDRSDIRGSSENGYFYHELRGDRFRLQVSGNKRYRLTARFGDSPGINTAGSIGVLRLDPGTGERSSINANDDHYDDGVVWVEFDTEWHREYYVDVDSAGLDSRRNAQIFTDYTLMLEDISDVENVVVNDQDNPAGEDSALSQTQTIVSTNDSSRIYLAPFTTGYSSQGWELDRVRFLLDNIGPGAWREAGARAKVGIDLLDSESTSVCSLTGTEGITVRQPRRTYEGRTGYVFDFLAGGCAGTKLERNATYRFYIYAVDSTDDSGRYRMIQTSKTGQFNGGSGWTIGDNSQVTTDGATFADADPIVMSIFARESSAPQTQLASNTPATGVPGITGTASLDETLTADTSGIADDDGMTGAVFTYQWIRRDLATTTDTDIEGATGSAYTVTAEDEGHGIRVRVTFTDDAGNEESLTSITLLSAPPIIIPDDEDVSNTPATGAPTISGTAQAGETLTADTSAIADDDGLTSAAFAYRWLADDTDIPDATGSTYTLSEDDVGKAIKVTVTFIDDAGYDESLTSDPTEPVAPRPNTPATGAPAISGSALVGETLTADTSAIADDDGLTNATFAYKWLADDTAIPDATASTYTLSDADVGKTIKVTVTFIDDAGYDESLTSDPTEPVAPRPNTPATGAPAISGSALVGQTLTADTSAIADEDGLTNATFAYKWLADDTAIPDATASTYTLSDADVGKTIKVTVTFTDDAGNEESLTSAATEAVKPLLTASFHDTPDSHDGANTFTFELRFSENIPISYRTLRDHAFTVTGGEVTQARRLNPSGDSRNLRWEITVRPDGNGAVTIVLPPTGDCNDDGAICTADGRKLSNRLELVVPRSGG